MSRALTAVLVIFAVAMLDRVAAQSTATPERSSATSVVMTRCQDCGTIESIREVSQDRAAPPPGTASSESPIGLVMYIPLGRPTAGSEGKYVGSVGNREWQDRTRNTRYEYTVRMDNGNYQFAQKQGVSDLIVGDRVKVDRGQIERME